MVVTVFCSVFAHGLTAFGGANWYASRMATVHEDLPEMIEVKAMPTRLSWRSFKGVATVAKQISRRPKD